jgi:RimJ/RimL family protein N-acetyltransferase
MIKGSRIELRAIEREDLPRNVEWLNDPDVMAYFGPLEPMSLADEERWFESQMQQSNVRNFSIYCEGEHVGSAGYSRIDWRERSAEVGLFIGNKELWNRNIGTDVMSTLVQFGFEQMNLHRICLRVYEENVRAIACYQKVGFQQEGKMRDASFRHGRYHHILWMSILEDEYRAGARDADTA